MKQLSYLLSFVFYFLSQTAIAQSADPVVMKINGKDVTRSEFEYNFNKNNTDGVIDKKSVEEYAELFINYKLKVEAALDAKFDTLSSYQQEFRSYRDQQIRPLLVTPEAEEAEVPIGVGIFRPLDADAAHGMAAAVVDAAETAIVTAHGRIVVRGGVVDEIGGLEEAGAIEVGRAAVHVSGEGVEIVRGGDEVGIFRRAAAAPIWR